MPDKERVIKCLKSFDFKSLFVNELGWDNHKLTRNYPIDGINYTLEAVAEKRGFAVFTCESNDGIISDYNRRKKIDNTLAKEAYEHLIIFIDSKKHNQTWQWTKRTKGKPASTRCENYNIHQSGELIFQKLENLYVSLQEEEELSLTDITARAKKAFDTDKVTKKFYEKFKTEHNVFKTFIHGITEQVDRDWYTSLMLNRLMFIYFIQKKGFLDNDSDYLRNRLDKIQQEKGKDQFHSFYRQFLLILFHKGLGDPIQNRSEEVNQLIGRIPYLNGGLFDVHELENKYDNIQIPDEAFKKIFDFFDYYQWHLDDRPLRNDNEINPDVIGYIFEKYINQKQMGAYYTKEDITGYISRNTIIPYIFDSAKEKCKIAFDKDSYIWKLLKDNPERYIYDAVKKGIDKNLPPEIEEGITDVSKRTLWNNPAPPDYALPTEIWREVVERRQRYQEIISKIENNEIHAINDFITYNLDIEQFALDVISNAESSDLLRAIYYTIAGKKQIKSNETDKPAISILDPTCGSGAFLFSALNMLEPLYEECIERMREFVKEDALPGSVSQSVKLSVEFILNIFKSFKNHAELFILSQAIYTNIVLPHTKFCA